MQEKSDLNIFLWPTLSNVDGTVEDDTWVKPYAREKLCDKMRWGQGFGCKEHQGEEL